MYSQFKRHGTNQHCRNEDVSICDKDLMNAFMSCHSRYSKTVIYSINVTLHPTEWCDRRTDRHTHTHTLFVVPDVQHAKSASDL